MSRVISNDPKGGINSILPAALSYQLDQPQIPTDLTDTSNYYRGKSRNTLNVLKLPTEPRPVPDY
jgi:hypothetical protein